MKFKCIVSYDGTLFHGFQTQDIKDNEDLIENPRTVQEEIEKALFEITNIKTNITYASRTDSGVHALGQVFHFETDLNIDEVGMKRALNSKLADDIHIISCEKVDDSFNARADVIKKEYHYYINLGEYNPIQRNYVYTPQKVNIKKFDLNKAIEASKVLLGKHDFRSFTKAKNLANYEREIYSIDFEQKGDILVIKFLGNGFLHNMVRILAAMLFECGMNNYTQNQLKLILEQKNRQFAPKILPSSGLYLVKVYYE